MSIEVEFPLASQLEVASRVLPVSATGFTEAETVLRNLAKRFTLRAHSTALHIHQGNSYFGFPLRTICNVMILETVFSILWDRHEAESSRGAKHCSKPAPQDHDAEKLLDRYGRATAILQAKSLEDLIKITKESSTGRHCAVHLGCFRSKRTIAFQTESSTNHLTILAWVKVTAAWVKYAHQVYNKELFHLLTRCADPKFSMLSFLTALGCDHVKDLYLPTVLNHWRKRQASKTGASELAKIKQAFCHRDKVMATRKLLWETQGKRSTRYTTEYDHDGDERKNWIPWTSFPYKYPWNEEMAAWSNSALPAGQEHPEDILLLRKSARSISVGPGVLVYELRFTRFPRSVRGVHLYSSDDEDGDVVSSVSECRFNYALSRGSDLLRSVRGAVSSDCK